MVQKQTMGGKRTQGSVRSSEKQLNTLLNVSRLVLALLRAAGRQQA